MIARYKRREFIKATCLAGIGLISSNLFAVNDPKHNKKGIINNIFTDKVHTKLEDGSIHSTPYIRIDSGIDGPSLLLVAAQHGNEVQGVEVARRFKDYCAGNLAAGNVWIIPIADLRAVRSRKYTVESTPEKRFTETNLNRSWPGDVNGHSNQRIANSLNREIVRYCTHAVDIHCWEHYRAAETLSESNNEQAAEMAGVTTTRFISYGVFPGNQNANITIRRFMSATERAAITIELAGQYQMREDQVLIGLSSMINIAKQLGMINGEPEILKDERAVRTKETSYEITAPCSGIFMPAKRIDSQETLTPDDLVVEGQQLGHIINEKNLKAVPFFAPVSGYLWHLGLCHWNLCDILLSAQHPYVEKGDTVAVIVKT